MKNWSKSLLLGSLVLLSIVLFGCNRDKGDYFDDTLDVNQVVKIGSFGGSVSSLPASVVGRNIWADSLEADSIECLIQSRGVGGAGFSTKTGDNNICNQIANSSPYDVYVLWASTNDAMLAQKGEFDSTDPATQNGGIRRAFELIQSRNPSALILFLTSLPRFDESYWKVYDYSVDQTKVCEQYNVPYLFQFELKVFTQANAAQYYVDSAHINEAGYALIAPYQAHFIKEQIKKWKNENKR